MDIETGTDISETNTFIDSLLKQIKVLEKEKQKALAEAERAKKKLREARDANRAKRVFLVSMNHELRTPIHSIQGLVELLLQTGLDSQQRRYGELIRTSAKCLQGLISNTLDISRIEAGKLVLTEKKYDVGKLINDLIALTNSRMCEKNLVFVTDIAPDIPRYLVGEEMRVSQIVLNLLSNSIKFTEKGSVTLSVRAVPEEDSVMLEFSVTDTGIGMKQQDMTKLFTEYYRLDRRRNSSIEGSGLGLAISRALAEKMHGSIGVKSVYGKGSVFTMSVKQGRTDDGSPLVAPLDASARDTVIVIFEPEKETEKSLVLMAERLGLAYRICASAEEFETYVTGGSDRMHVFFSYRAGYPLVRQTAGIPHIQCFTALLSCTEILESPTMRRDIRVVQKPVTIMDFAQCLSARRTDPVLSRIEPALFAVNNCRALIVDDNEISRMVVAGMLEKMGFSVDEADSGAVAIEIVKKNVYDIIFMDHLMEGIDGCETTRIIRSFGGAGQAVPVIALTANAVSGMEKLFEAAGMNDFISKPIDSVSFTAVLRKWIPESKWKTVPM